MCFSSCQALVVLFLVWWLCPFGKVEACVCISFFERKKLAHALACCGQVGAIFLPGGGQILCSLKLLIKNKVYSYCAFFACFIGNLVREICLLPFSTLCAGILQRAFIGYCPSYLQAENCTSLDPDLAPNLCDCLQSSRLVSAGISFQQRAQHLQ